MADNPFYPGYVPNPKDGIPPSNFFPGYFPGQPTPRKGFIPPNVGPLPYNFDDVLQQINLVQGNVDLMTSGMPKWVYERAVDDFKRSLQVYMEANNVNVEELDDFDAEAIPGAFNVGVSLNPMDWINDPGKQAMKTLNQWKSEAFSWKDMDSRFRRDLWSQILSDKPNYTMYAGELEAAQAITERINRPAGAGPIESTTGRNPMALRGLGVMGYDVDEGPKAQRQFYDFHLERDASGHVRRVDAMVYDPAHGGLVMRRIPEKSATRIDRMTMSGHYDVYEKLANSVIEFETSSGYAPSRQGSYATVLRNTVHAIDADLSQKKFKRIIESDAERKKAFDIFKSQADVLGDMEILEKRYKAVSKAVSKEYLIKKDSIDWGGMASWRRAVQESIDGIENNYGVGGIVEAVDRKEAERMRAFLDPYKQHLEKVMNSELMSVIGENTRLDGLKKGLENDLKYRRITQAEFDTRIAPINSGIADLEQTVRANRGRYLREATSLGMGPFNGRGYLYKDSYTQVYERRLLEEVVAVDFARPRSKGKNKRIGDVVAEVPGNYAGRAIGIISRLEYEYQVMQIEEFFDAVESGKFLERYIWNKAKGYINSATPSYWVKKGLDKVHSLGLKTGDDDDFEKTMLGKLSGLGTIAGMHKSVSKERLETIKSIHELKISRSNPTNTAADIAAIDQSIADARTRFAALQRTSEATNMAAPGNLWGNWFKVKFEGGRANRRGEVDAFTAGVRISARLYGGGHFAGIKGLSEIRAMVRSGEWTPEALAFFIKNVGPDGLSDPSFLRRLLLLNKRRAIILPPGMDQAEFASQVMELREWVLKHRHRISTNVDMDSDAFWLSFVDMMANKMRDPDFNLIGITKRYAGLFEKVWNKLNEFQTMVFVKFGKILAPVSYVKTFIAEKIADLIPKLLALLGGAASGGTLAILLEKIGRILRPIIRFLVKKSLDFVQNFVGGLIHGDFGKALAELDKQVQALIKALLIFSSVPIIITVALSTMFFGASTTTISPIDPTRSAGEVDYFGAGLGNFTGNPTDMIGPGSPAANEGCFVFENNDEILTCNGTNYQLLDWPNPPLSTFQAAARAIMGTGYGNRLCASNTSIRVFWAESPVGQFGCTSSGCWWGETCGANSFVLNNAIPTTISNHYSTYLFAHESGHVWYHRYGEAFETVPGAITFSTALSEGKNPTYPGGCGTQSNNEDYAETIGNYFWVNVADCPNIPGSSYTEYWSQFPRHWQYIQEVLFRP